MNDKTTGLRCHDPDACAMGQFPCPTPGACGCAPVELLNFAVWDDGELRLLSGRKGPAFDCELYAMPDGKRAPNLYAAQPSRECLHRIADMRNANVASGFMCVDCGAIFAAAPALKAAAPAQAVASFITIDFKQAAELLEMFGGEPAEITLMTGEGHSGIGLYASYTDMPEEGAEFLGTSDDEALPAPPAQAVAVPAGLLQAANEYRDFADALLNAQAVTLGGRSLPVPAEWVAPLAAFQRAQAHLYEILDAAAPAQEHATQLAGQGQGKEPAFLQRLRAEQRELSGRQGKLEAFLETHGFHALADDAKGLLRKQESQQHALLQTLNQRIHSAAEQHLRSKNNG